MKMLRSAAIAAIVLAGLVLGTWIMRSERQVVAEEGEGGEEAAADEGLTAATCCATDRLPRR